MIDEIDLILYPSIKHPLANEKYDLKVKYINLLYYFANKYIDKKNVARRKILSLAESLIKDGKYTFVETESIKAISNEVLKTRFFPFRFFSYRYVFLFDALYLFAIGNKENGEHILEECMSWVNKRYHNKLTRIVELMFEGIADFTKETLITEEMKRAWLTVLRYLQTKESKIYFTATMSAGKSTLIDAIIGQNISSTKKAACTYKALAFNSLPIKRNNYVLVEKGSVLLEGDPRTIKDSMKNLQNKCSVYGYFESELSKRKSCMIDTPGVNSSLNPEHKKTTREALEQDEDKVLVYVIPVESYGSEDDYNHLLYILKHVKYRRIIFVVNMIDTCDFEDDSLDEIIIDIKEHLVSIGYENPEVYPISAKAGLLIKRKIQQEAMSSNEEDMVETYIKMFLRNDYSLSNYYAENVRIESYENDIVHSYEETGLPELERLLCDI